MMTLVAITDALAHVFLASLLLAAGLEGIMRWLDPAPRLRAQLWLSLLVGLSVALVVMIAGGTVSPSIAALGSEASPTSVRDGAAWRIPLPAPALVVIGAAWVLAAVVLALGLLRDGRRTWLHVRHLHRDGKAAPEPICEAWHALGGTRGTLRVTDTVQSPTLIGVHNPVLALPVEHVNDLGLADWTGILAHEAEHVRWLDDWQGLLARVARVLLGWNPVTWWVLHAYSTARETACDGAAVRASGMDPVEYGHLLVALGRRALARPALQTRLVGHANIRDRIGVLLNGIPGHAGGRLTVASAIIVFVLTTLATAKSPRVAMGPMGAGFVLSGRCEISLSQAERLIPGTGPIAFGVTGPGAIAVPCATSPGQRWARRLEGPPDSGR